MPSSFHTQRRVEFPDIDLWGNLHPAALGRYMEEAEWAFWRHLGLQGGFDGEEGRIGWPRVAVECECLETVKVEDRIDIELRVAERGERSIAYAFNLTRDSHPVATGRVKAVCCLMRGGRPKSAPIPQEIVERLESTE